MRWALLFHRYILRDLLQKPVRTLLTVAGVGLGMAVVWAVHLSNQRSIGSFTESIELVNGQADLQIRGNGLPVDEALIRELSWLWQQGRLSPLVEGRVRLSNRLNVPAYGVDLLADAPFRRYVSGDGRELFEHLTEAEFLQLLSRPNRLILPRRLARELNVGRGDPITLLIGDREVRFEVGALLRQTGAAEAFGGNIVFMDIASAQTAFSRLGRLDRIDVILNADATPEDVIRRLERELPASVSVWRPQDLTAQSQRMLRAFRFNLGALSYLSLIVGVILVYNTLNIAVVRRQSEIASLRTLGAGRGTIMSMFLLEAAALGLSGAALGLILGGVLARGAELLVGRTVESLYTGIDLVPLDRPADWEFALLVLLLGTGLGTLSGLFPALRATARPPVQVMREGFLVNTRRRSYRIPTALGCVGIVIAGGLSLAPPVAGLPLFGYLSALVLMVSFAMLAPRLASLLLRSLEPFRRRFPVEARLALQSVRGGLSRLVVAMISLMIAVAMLVGVASMVGSFRETVKTWLDQTLVADLYVRAAGAGSNDWANPIRPDTLQRLEATPGVLAMGRFRGRQIDFRGLPVTLAGGDFEVLADHGRLLFVDGRATPDVVRRLIGRRSVIVSEPLALRRRVKPGDELLLPTPRGPQPFEVEAVYYDYSSDRGVIVMDWHLYRELFNDAGATSVSLYLEPGRDPQQVRGRLLEEAGDAHLQVYANQQLKKRALVVFDQTFQVTYALEVIAILVAVLGITNTLGALILERQGEVALLQFLGADRGQLRGMAFYESGLIGALGVAAGAVLGWLLSLLLILVINRQSFGWTLQIDLPLTTLGAALGLILLSTLAAGFYPALVTSATDPIRSLRAE